MNNTQEIKIKKERIEEEEDWNNRDSAVFRYRNGTTRVVGDVELAEAFKKRGNDDFWKEIYCIQTIVKSKIGIGQHIFVDFVAPFDKSSPYYEIKYDFRQFKNEEEWTTEEYCLKQTYKIWYYIQKVYSYEILKMRWIFLKDDSNKIWLHYIQDIVVRKLQNVEQLYPFWLRYELTKSDFPGPVAEKNTDLADLKYTKLKLSNINSRSVERDEKSGNVLETRIYDDFIKIKEK